MITAQNIQQLIIENNQWSQVQHHTHTLSASLDHDLYLIHDAILHGSPALSDNWQLFSSNQALTETAKQHQAATVVLSIQSNLDIVEMTSGACITSNLWFSFKNCYSGTFAPVFVTMMNYFYNTVAVI